jgi:FkbM family methyltransferase
MQLKKIAIRDGFELAVDSQLELHRANTLFQKEPETIAWIDRWTDKNNTGGKVFFDIGANIGIYSLYAAYKTRDADIYSFEPVAINFRALKLNVNVNNYANVHTFNIALSNNNSLSNLYINDERAGNSGAQVGRSSNERGEIFQPVKVERVISFSLNKLVSEFGFPFPNYVKIDVDGRETDILEGMSTLLGDPRLQSILVEFNNLEELASWKDRLRIFGLDLDNSFDDVPGHSRIRSSLIMVRQLIAYSVDIKSLRSFRWGL